MLPCQHTAEQQISLCQDKTLPEHAEAKSSWYPPAVSWFSGPPKSYLGLVQVPLKARGWDSWLLSQSCALQDTLPEPIHSYYWLQIDKELSWHLLAPVRWRSGVCQVRCPLPLGAGACSPSHVCCRALSAHRDPGFHTELSHAIVPQNSSALRIFSKGLMGQYVWFSTVSTLAWILLLSSLPAFLLTHLASGGRDGGCGGEEPWRW